MEIKYWIMNWGLKALVIDPESLREEIRTESEALLEKYRDAEMVRQSRANYKAKPVENGGIYGGKRTS
ncbi:MAG: hypothetical protein JW836_11010 [Deltaproteobacteria bacterium]|nr:hypothetical protein [Deltaproteobacteria bacterium]